jgi:hypothetical protein
VGNAGLPVTGTGYPDPMTTPTPPPLMHGPEDDGDPALERENYGTGVDPARRPPEGPLGDEQPGEPDDPMVAGSGFDKPIHVETADER